MKNTNNKVTLYIATHNTTGLKYFGKTTKYFIKEDLQKYYHGSGVDWKLHLKEFGNNVTMEIYGIYDFEEVRKAAIKFSKDNSIVESELWANRIRENGFNGGGSGWILSNERKKEIGDFHRNKVVSKESRERMSKAAIGREVSEETKLKMSKTRKGRKHSEEHSKSISEALKGRVGPKASEDTKLKMSKAKKGIKQPRGTCPHCNFEGGLWSMKGHHFDKCKNKKEKLFQ